MATDAIPKKIEKEERKERETEKHRKEKEKKRDGVKWKGNKKEVGEKRRSICIANTRSDLPTMNK